MAERRALLTPRLSGALARAPCVTNWSEVIRLAERRALRTEGQAIETDANVRLPLQVEWDVSRRVRRPPQYVGRLSRGESRRGDVTCRVQSLRGHK